MIPKISAENDGRYWVLGGRWQDDGRALPWPRVFGPFANLEAARASAETLNSVAADGQLRFMVVADIAEAPP